jgi:hypothetical protein
MLKMPLSAAKIMIVPLHDNIGSLLIPYQPYKMYGTFGKLEYDAPIM